MALFYKNAKKEVQNQYNDLTNRGFQPTANADGTTYSWIHKDTGEVYKGLDPISGVDAESGYRLRNHRQQRLMSELASSNLVQSPEKKTAITPPPPSSKLVSKPTVTTVATQTDNTVKTPEVTQAGTGLENLPFIRRPETDKPKGMGWYPGRDLINGPVVETPADQHESAYGRPVPNWEDPKKSQSRLIYISDKDMKDPNSEYNKLKGGFFNNMGSRRGGAGNFGVTGDQPVSQAQVDWYNTQSDITPQLPISGMHRANDKYYPPTKKDEDGNTRHLVYNPTFIRGRFDTQSGAENYAKSGWGRERPIKEFDNGEYGVGTNFWDQVKTVGGEADAAAAVLLQGMGLSPETIAGAGNLVKSIKGAIKNPKTIIQAAKNLVSKNPNVVNKVARATNAATSATTEGSNLPALIPRTTTMAGPEVQNVYSMAPRQPLSLSGVTPKALPPHLLPTPTARPMGMGLGRNDGTQLTLDLRNKLGRFLPSIGYKSGGKLVAKKKTKMKGCC